ncbi:ran-binding protein 3-like isoform X2 [Spea bombifrons]|uniref:ran-binding protein 3-like isoform X2 n=1 Tax=Spea bombifrons TaxID=233779 RepID=UPI00234B1EED|nr:ran-binding protein 3-like isoform X2 [Spea bombifrons]
MRNQQTSIFKVNVFSAQIEPLCGDSEASSPSFHKATSDRKKASMCITASNREGDKGNTRHVPSKPSGGPGQSCSECQQDPCKDKLMLPHPLLMLEKKERPFKRHASDLVLNAEYGICMYPEKRVRSSSFTFQPSYSPPHKGNGVSEKRVRSCSFTMQPAFPPSQPALKNNVFMPSSLLQEHQKKSTTSPESLQPWNVIKPATLQPPKVSLCQNEKPDMAGNELTSDQAKHKLEKCNMATENASKSKNGIGPTCILDIKNRSQPFAQLSDRNTCDFVFGVDIEKRVMSAQRPELSAFQSKWEDTSSRLHLSLRSCPYQKPCPDNSRSLVESAAAYSSRPSVKYELDQVEIITGEESERNVLQMICKLFVLNIATQTWTERGRGYLRLNDMGYNDNGMFRSRIVTCCTRFRLRMVGKCGPVAPETPAS